MTSAAAGGRAGPAGTIQGKSVEELLEMLERQEKLLSDRKFIAKLPDRGKKIQDVAEKLRAAIAEQKGLKETTDIMSKFKVEFKEQQIIVKERNQTKKTMALQAEIKPSLSQDTLHNQFKCNVDTALSPFTDELSHKTGGAGIPPVQEGENLKTADDLVLRMNKVSIEDNTEQVCDGSQPSKAMQSHYLEVIEKRTRSPVQRKEKFRTNRLPADSDCASPHQSPGERALKLPAEERRAEDRKHLDDITAATFPPLHHSAAVLISLEESLSLQLKQNKVHEEEQAKLAAQQLCKKLHIKMTPFNPEGESYMKYRDQRDEEGHDAEE